MKNASGYLGSNPYDVRVRRPCNTPVGLSGEIISHSHIGQEFAWPPEDPRQARQTQREYMASHAKRVVDAQGLTQFYEPVGGQG